jgi:L-2-hydroxyglutarate oxidase
MGMKYDITIIGGGIVGLATALKLKELNPNLNIALLEKESSLSQHQTGNNSGVIHSGIYYKPGSLKALNCIKGYKMLLDFCDKESIKYEICGKLIVATSKKELPGLHDLFERAQLNGLKKVKKLQGGHIKEYEPNVAGIEALFIPNTGIVDFLEVSNKYAEIFTEKYGGNIYLSHKVNDIINYDNHSEVITTKGNFQAKLVVNTAGLYSDKIARINRKDIQVRIIPFRGEYVELVKAKNYLVKNLVYPVPDLNFPFLGVHFTRMIKGGVEAGPNAVWAFKKEGYKKTDFNLGEFWEALSWKGFRKVMLQYWKMGLGEYYRSFSKNAHIKSLQRLVPDIKKQDIVKGGSGVRAQACDKNGGLIDDFLIVEDKYQFNVLNAPSPAATASLSIGETLSKSINKRFS